MRGELQKSEADNDKGWRDGGGRGGGGGVIKTEKDGWIECREGRGGGCR